MIKFIFKKMTCKFKIKTIKMKINNQFNKSLK